MADEKPPEGEPPEGEPVKPTNEQITDSLFNALQGDENLTDDDRREIAEGLSKKSGGKAPEAVKPDAQHWTKKELW